MLGNITAYYEGSSYCGAITSTIYIPIGYKTISTYCNYANIDYVYEPVLTFGGKNISLNGVYTLDSSFKEDKNCPGYYYVYFKSPYYTYGGKAYLQIICKL